MPCVAVLGVKRGVNAPQAAPLQYLCVGAVQCASMAKRPEFSFHKLQGYFGIPLEVC